jgi:hypothetical protein
MLCFLYDYDDVSATAPHTPDILVCPMNRLTSFVLLIVACVTPLLFATAVVAQDGAGQSSVLAWPEVTQESRPWTRWWWPGNAVEKSVLTELLETYELAGLGGVEITPIYGIRGKEDRFMDFLSPTWMDMLAHTIAEGGRLDLGVDMTTGTGWPFGGPQVDLQHAATRAVFDTYSLRAGDRMETPVTHRDENVNEPAGLQALVAVSTDGTIEALTGRVDAEGRLNWIAPQGEWQLYALFRGWTGQRVKRAAPGGEGLVMNHYARYALQHYLDRFDDAFRQRPEVRPRAFFNDSYEAYGADWTPNLLEEFEERRGYDLRRYLPTLAGDGDQELVARVKSDYRETISDLLLDDFTVEWTEWAHRIGSITRNQAHGSPGNILDLYAAADIPETETFGPAGNPDNDPLIGKFASSAANVAGRPLSSSESATWLREHFTVTLQDLKGVIDQVFITGINHVFYHGTAYSPPGEDWPGWLFYASTQLNPGNPIWRDLPTLNRYIARCQSILQTGSPDNDILLYWPVYDNWHDASGLLMNFPVHAPEWFYGKPFGQLAAQLWDLGYAFDYVSDRLLTRARVEADSRIRTAGAAYRVIVVPATEHMPVATFEKLLGLARAGATILFEHQLPVDIPGVARSEELREQISAMKRSLSFEGTEADGVRRANLGDGRVLLGNDIHAMLGLAGVERERMTDLKGVQFVRRTHAEGHHYFIRNAGESALDGWVELAVPAMSVALLDPMTEQAGVARTRVNTAGRVEIYLQLQPGKSVILRTFDRAIEELAWPYSDLTGPPVTLGGLWDVEFIEGGPELPAAFRAPLPGDWTARDDADAERFAGTARYSIRFDSPGVSDSCLLDLGEVAHSARVRLNGQVLGTLIGAPYQVEIDAFKPTDNLLEVEVTNLAANRIRDLDRRGIIWRKFYDINFVNIDYEAFDASDWPIRPSGLIGPVRLFPIQRH